MILSGFTCSPPLPARQFNPLHSEGKKMAALPVLVGQSQRSLVTRECTLTLPKYSDSRRLVAHRCPLFCAEVYLLPSTTVWLVSRCLAFPRTTHCLIEQKSGNGTRLSVPHPCNEIVNCVAPPGKRFYPFVCAGFHALLVGHDIISGRRLWTLFRFSYHSGDDKQDGVNVLRASSTSRLVEVPTRYMSAHE